MAAIYTFRECMDSPQKSDTDLILARFTFSDGKLTEVEKLLEPWIVEALDFEEALSPQLYDALVGGICEDVQERCSAEEDFRRFIKYFIHDFYFRKEK